MSPALAGFPGVVILLGLFALVGAGLSCGCAISTTSKTLLLLPLAHLPEALSRKSRLESGGKANDCALAPHHAKQRKPVSSSSATQFGAADAGIPHPEGGREAHQGGQGRS